MFVLNKQSKAKHILNPFLFKIQFGIDPTRRHLKVEKGQTSLRKESYYV